MVVMLSSCLRVRVRVRVRTRVRAQGTTVAIIDSPVRVGGVLASARTDSMHAPLAPTRAVQSQWTTRSRQWPVASMRAVTPAIARGTYDCQPTRSTLGHKAQLLRT